MRLNGDGPPLWCDDHGDQLAQVAASIGKLSGPAADSLRGRWAMKIASAVWAGRTGDLHQVVGTAATNTTYKAAMNVALGNDWLAKRENGRGVERGPTPPPGFDLTTLPAADQPRSTDPDADSIGRVPVDVRVERLRALVQERGEVPKVEAATEIGLTNTRGSWARVLARAVKTGRVLSGTNVVRPGPNITLPV